MRLSSICILALLALLASCNAKSQSPFIVNIPSAKSEANYIWQTLQDIQFFEENNYQISLPKGRLIEELKVKSKINKLSDKDYEKLVQHISDSVYHKSNYLKGYEKVIKELKLLNKMIREIDTLNFNWSFQKFDNYIVNLTLYGPGGSYNPNEGSILLFTTPEGKFKNYKNPANTIIHEIVHIGIEASIINKFNIPHTLKERIVDTFVSLNFKQYLPSYKIQDMGDYRIDKYLKTKEDLKELQEFAQKIMNTKK